MRTLDELRREIDEVDSGIKALYARRLAAVKEVAEYKIATGGKVFNPQREKEVLAALEDTFGLSDVYRAVMRRSREYQYRKMIETGAVTLPYVFSDPGEITTVYYQGIDGSYSSVAAHTLYPDAKYVSVASFADVAETVLASSNAVGILPIDNSTEGSVNATYDLILKHDIYITSTVTIPVRHCLVACPGTALADIKTVTSHPQALAQCRGFLNGYTTVPSSNTAVAAQDVASAGDKTIAAVCSQEAAVRYGLEILASNIQDEDCNATRFACLSRCLQKNGKKMSVVLNLDHVSGALSGLLSIFADYGVNLTKIQSRPIHGRQWEYSFYLDFDADYDDLSVQALLYQLTEELPYVKLLGVYA